MAKKPAKLMPIGQATASEDEIDACDVDFATGDLTPDEHLPEAAGGVHEPTPGGGNEDDVDACDVDFTRGDLTADEDLPASAGGVAS
jgi:hypothetical protein